MPIFKPSDIILSRERFLRDKLERVIRHNNFECNISYSGGRGLRLSHKYYESDYNKGGYFAGWLAHFRPSYYWVGADYESYLTGKDRCSLEDFLSSKIVPIEIRRVLVFNLDIIT